MTSTATPSLIRYVPKKHLLSGFKIPKMPKMLINSSTKEFIKRFLGGLLRDFLRGGVIFIVLFILIMLHLTKTVEVTPLTWILDRDKNTQTQDASDSKQNDSKQNESEYESDSAPNLLPRIEK